MADHYLHLWFGNWGPEWTLVCNHAPDAHPVLLDPPGGPVDPNAEGECWAQSWWTEQALDEIEWGDTFPRNPPLPIPVVVEYHDGLCLSYDDSESLPPGAPRG